MDLKIKEVANLLQVSEATINKWIQDNKIPVYKINNQYRFDRLEVEKWMMGHDRSFGEKGVDEPKGTQAFSLYRAIHKGDVLSSLKGGQKEAIIREAVGAIAAKEGLDAEGLTELLLDREKLMSTGLGHGIAIPHTRDTFLEGKPDFVTVVFPKKAIPYDSLDGGDVHTLFFLFASNDKRHLHLLAKIAYFSQSEETRQFLKGRPTKEALLEYIRNWEEKL